MTRLWRGLSPLTVIDPDTEVEIVNVPAAKANCTCGNGHRCDFCHKALRPLEPGERRPDGFDGARRHKNATAIPALRPGQRVVLTDHVRDGEVYSSRDVMFIGCWGKPERTFEDELEHARDVASWIVRRGFADLNWPGFLSRARLWNVPNDPPAPKPLGSGERLYARLAAASPYPF